MGSRKSKRDITEDFESMSEEELLYNYCPRVNVEFDILGVKYIFKNINDDFLKDFSIYEFIRIIEIKTQWYNNSYYDTVFVRDIPFMIIEYSNKKVVAVRGNN